MSKFHAYIAGFLDADGSIYVRLKPNLTYKYGFQIAPAIVFFQKKTAEDYLKSIQKKLNFGYLRYRKDGIIEYTIGDRKSIKKLLALTINFIILKKKQAKLMLKILDLQSNIQSAHDFINLAKLIDKFGQLNYSKKRTVNAQMVRNHLISKRNINPVETC